MALHIYNTLTRRLAPFIPPSEGPVRMYVCGVTVYDRCHLGHGRAYTAFDSVRRYLEFLGHPVRLVRNVTDIDDKIIRKAPQEFPGVEIGEACRRVADKYYADFLEQMRRLNVLPGTVEPRATTHVPEMLALIGALMERGCAYAAKDGVYFRVASFPAYGRLSGKHLDELVAGSRVEVNEGKESPLDFVLWKFRKPGEPFWPSPWGEGRPGWHIECSAMAAKHLGGEIDIHAGGEDLVFPHHENEIAQSEAATGRPFARTWMHNGFVRVNDEKMSKSLGNFQTLEDVFRLHPGKVVRFFFLSKHYRMPIDLTPDSLHESTQALRRIEQCAGALKARLGGALPPEVAPRHTAPAASHPAVRAFCAAMDDDFNTSGALGALFEHVTHVNRQLAANEPAAALAESAAALLLMTDTLGLVRAPAVAGEETLIQGSAAAATESFDDLQKLLALPSLTDEETQRLVLGRVRLRAGKKWAEADLVRNGLARLGVTIKDTKDGSTWTRNPAAASS